MKRPDGVTLLAIYHFIIGIPLLIGACAILVFAVPAVTFNNNDPTGMIGALFGLSIGLLFAGGGGIVALIAGAGLLALKEWARWLALGLAILSLPLFPIGTITGGVTLWYLLQEQVRAAFNDGGTPTTAGYRPTPVSPPPVAPTAQPTVTPENPVPDNSQMGMEAAEAGMDATKTETEAHMEESYAAEPLETEMPVYSASETIVSGSANEQPETVEPSQVELEGDKYSPLETVVSGTAPEMSGSIEPEEGQPPGEGETAEPASDDFSSMETRVGNLPPGEDIPSAPPAINLPDEDNSVEQDESGFASAEIATDENDSGLTEWQSKGVEIFETPSQEAEDTGMEMPESTEEEKEEKPSGSGEDES